MDGEGPLTPRKDDLRLEKTAEEVTLRSADAMFTQLTNLTMDDGERAHFIPRLLQHAGQKVMISEVPRIITESIDGYIRAQTGTMINMRHFAAKRVPALIDAMIEDLQKQEKARAFFLSALDG